MSIAKGDTVYVCENEKVSISGVILTEDELVAALAGPIAANLHDDEGAQDLEEFLAPLAETGFANISITRILSHNRTPESWRVGEELAECYLKSHRNCSFPRPGSRDQKNPNASQAGTDLVGFQCEENETRFAFGEVKTSYENKYPPQVVTSRHGMAKQLEDLFQKNGLTTDHLVQYLVLNSRGQDWVTTLKEAAKRYLVNPHDVVLYGILVRDVSPGKNDLQGKGKELGEQKPESTEIELLAIYLPEGSIPSLGERCAGENIV